MRKTRAVKTFKREFRFPVADDKFVKSIDSPYEGACVMVAVTKRGVALRDSKDANKTTLFYTRREWAAFLKGVARRQFDL